ncbi:MAG: Mrp/NBP35 family ATP-binding protein [Bdellovibrionales bacterium]|nr:Mrp/NBP35 family ATP-binding protein [Bdellovibrionales bacterium]
MNPFLQQAPIEGVKKIIAVGSGKGGVGKSTVAVNLAMALQKRGMKVGLLDADIYGPSIPRMLGALTAKPEVNDDKKIIPVTRYGVKTMSLGYLVEESQAAVWRGPMLFKAMDQFFRDVLWGELDYLIIDLPPGTGDVGLTMAQKVPVTGAIVVVTPQNIALADAKKAIDMFDRTNVRLLGIVENMSYYTSQTGEKVQLFPQGELDAYLDTKKIKKLAQLPFYPDIGMSAEAGVPVLESHSGDEEAEMFLRLADQVRDVSN